VNIYIYIMNGFICIAFVFVAGVYNFTRPTRIPVKRESVVEPRNEIMNRPDHFMMGNQYSPKFNKKK
jgi:hypothetical protein